MSYWPKHLERAKANNKTILDGQRSGEQTLRRNRNVSFKGMMSQGTCLKESSTTQTIIERLEKHIQYLEKKLTAAEDDVNRLADLLTDLQHRCTLKQADLNALATRLAQEQKFTEELLKKYEGEEETGKINGMKKLMSACPDSEGKEQNKLKCKPGKFSAAFLPTGFNSPNRVKGHKAEAFGGIFRDSSCRYLHQNDSKVGNLYNQDLMKEWKKEKRQKAFKSKEVEELTAKNQILLKQVSSQKSLLTTLKHEASRTELRLNQQVSKLRKQSKFHSRHRDKLIEQLKLSQEQVNYLMQYAPDEDDTFTTFDLKGLVQRESSELLMDSGVSQFMLRPTCKQTIAIQTDEVQVESGELVKLEKKIKQLQTELQVSMKHQDLIELKYREECQEYETAIELYKLRIEQLDYTIQMSGSRDYSKDEVVDEGVNCEIVPSYVCEERQEILEKVKLLLQVNEGLKLQLSIEEKNNDKLQLKIRHLKDNKAHTCEEGVQTNLQTDDAESTKRHRLYSFGQDEDFTSCNSCTQMASRLLSLQQQRNHFSNKYEETLTALQYQQQDAQAEILKMHEAITEKDTRLRKVVEEAEREEGIQREVISLLRGKVAAMEGCGEGWEEIGSVFDN